jgi:hypothetical protein
MPEEGVLRTEEEEERADEGEERCEEGGASAEAARAVGDLEQLERAVARDSVREVRPSP